MGIMLSEMGHRKTITIWFHLYVESKNKWTKQKQAHRYREQTGGCQKGGCGGGGWQNKWGELRGTDFSYKIDKSWYIIYSRENIVNNIVITLYSDKWWLDLLV